MKRDIRYHDGEYHKSIIIESKNIKLDNIDGILFICADNVTIQIECEKLLSIINLKNN